MKSAGNGRILATPNVKVIWRVVGAVSGADAGYRNLGSGNIEPDVTFSQACNKPGCQTENTDKDA
jgi:hypothetical protein